MARESRFLPELDLPEWAFTPGEIHPEDSAPTVGRPSGLFQSYWHGWDLLLLGYPWEAHEAWEPIWRTTNGPTRSWVQGLIRLAAALCKAREKNWAAIDHHLEGAWGHWETIPRGQFYAHHILEPMLQSWISRKNRLTTLQGWREQAGLLAPGNPGPVLSPGSPGGCPPELLMALGNLFSQTASNSAF